MQRKLKGAILLVAIILLSAGCEKSTTAQKISAHLQPGATFGPTTVIVPQPKTTSTPVIAIPRRLTIFLPGRDGKLQRAMWQEPDDMVKKPRGLPESSLSMLFRKGAQYFPRGTRLVDTVSKNNDYIWRDGTRDTVFEVNLSKEFLRPTFWRKRRKAVLAFEAIAATASHAIDEDIEPTYPVNVSVLVAGLPVRRLGQFEIENPYESR